jgi:putative hydroxymethylpyrimidine transport system substrate-binding protein
MSQSMGAKMGTKTIAMGLLVAAAAVLLGCGERKERPGSSGEREIDLALDFYVNPDHAGIYQALENGHFAEAGLEVEPRVPSDPSAPLRQVAAGRADLAISYEPEVLLARDQGLPVVAVAALVSEPLTSLISTRDAGIEEVDDLRGKTVATAGIPYQDAFLEAILRKQGLGTDDVENVDVGFNLLPALLSGRADAMLGGFRNVEGVDLELRGAGPRVVPVDEIGIPTYDELVVVAGEEMIESEPETIRLFLDALEQGTRDAVADPKTATETILAEGEGLEPKLTAAEIDATLPLLLPRSEKARYGEMDAREWERFARFLADEGLIETLPEIEEVVSNELLPGNVPE